MNYRTPLMVLGATLSLLFGKMAYADPETEAPRAAQEAERQAQLEAEYESAVKHAEAERQAAEASMARAREQLRSTSRQREKAEAQSAAARAAQEAEMEKMHEELAHTRRQLAETSREVSRVNREVARARASSRTHSANFVFRTSDRPIIGVILGDANDVGVKVLGVSPDGPSERAGIKQGDVIVAMDGRVLAAVEESGDPKTGLKVAMKSIKPEEPVIVSVERGEQTLDLTVVPEVREPLTWQTVTRFPSVPVAPGEVHSPEHIVRVERIEVPEIDTEALSEQIEEMRVEIETRRALMESGEFAPHLDGEYEFEFHELSEMGNFALQDANVWFGLPMAQGLKLAEIDEGLGEYFKTDRGVLVLKAKEDNELQLQTGDVILQVGDTEVNSPAEFMRALRDVDEGDEFDIEIKRKRKDRTLTAVMPENRTSFLAPDDGGRYTINITTHSD
jgi:C-terminal processing protease CtpA/Prc